MCVFPFQVISIELDMLFPLGPKGSAKSWCYRVKTWVWHSKSSLLILWIGMGEDRGRMYKFLCMPLVLANLKFVILAEIMTVTITVYYIANGIITMHWTFLTIQPFYHRHHLLRHIGTVRGMPYGGLLGANATIITVRARMYLSQDFHTLILVLSSYQLLHMVQQNREERALFSPTWYVVFKWEIYLFANWWPELKN